MTLRKFLKQILLADLNYGLGLYRSLFCKETAQATCLLLMSTSGIHVLLQDIV